MIVILEISEEKKISTVGIYFKTKVKRCFLLSNFGGQESVTWTHWKSWSLKISKNMQKIHNIPYFAFVKSKAILITRFNQGKHYCDDKT